MLRRHAEHEFDAAQRAAADAAAGGRIAARDRQIGATGRERVPAARQHLVAQPDLGRPPQPIESIEHRQQRRDGEDAFHRQRELWFPAARHLSRLVLQRVRGPQQRPPLVQQQAPRRGETRTVAGAVEQQCVEFGLDLLHGVGQRGWRAPQLFGGAGKRTLAVDGIENGERLQGQRHVRIIRMS